jgi:RNA polymerase sigma-70 factor (ECF subfamily)
VRIDQEFCPVKEETLVRNLIQHQRGFKAMIYSMTGDASITDDLFQEAAMVMTRKRAELPEEGNFGAWGRAICFNMVRDHRKKSNRRREHQLDDQSIELLYNAFEKKGSFILEDRKRALSLCVEKMEPQHRELLRKRYDLNVPVEQLASELSRTRSAMDTMLFRLRSVLAECVTRQLSSWGWQQ